MLKFLSVLLFMTGIVHAQVGEIVSLTGGSSSHLTRNGQRIDLSEGMQLEKGDQIRSEDTHVNLLIYPKIQMSLVRGTELVISSHLIEESTSGEKSTSVIGLIKGLVRILVTKEEGETVEQKVDAKDVTFAVRGTEYEVSVTEDDAELDVMEGEVEVSSPHVQTFVPEIVKPKEGFRFARKERKFLRRAFRERIQNSRFMKKEALRMRWKARKERRALRRNGRQEKFETRQNRREERREKIRERKNRGR